MNFQKPKAPGAAMPGMSPSAMRSPAMKEVKSSGLPAAMPGAKVMAKKKKPGIRSIDDLKKAAKNFGSGNKKNEADDSGSEMM